MYALCALEAFPPQPRRRCHGTGTCPVLQQRRAPGDSPCPLLPVFQVNPRLPQCNPVKWLHRPAWLCAASGSSVMLGHRLPDSQPCARAGMSCPHAATLPAGTFGSPLHHALVLKSDNLSTNSRSQFKIPSLPRLNSGRVTSSPSLARHGLIHTISCTGVT